MCSSSKNDTNVAIPFHQKDDWRKDCGGHGYEYLATDQEVAEILNEHLLDEFGPYRVITKVEEEWDGKKLVGVKFADSPIEEIESVFRNRLEWSDSFWVFSTHLTPCLRAPTAIGYSYYFAVNGLLEFNQSPSNMRGEKTSSYMSVIQRFVNSETGELREYDVYLKLFNRLKRQIKKRMCFESFKVCTKTGEELAEPRLPMTEGVAELARGDNNPYEYRPGPPLENKGQSKKASKKKVSRKKKS